MTTTTRQFDFWLRNAPVIQSGDTGGFTAWLKGAPVIMADAALFNIAVTHGLPYESVVPVSTQAGLPWESVVDVGIAATVRSGLPFESLLSITSHDGEPWESSATLRSIDTRDGLVFEVLASPLSRDVLPDEWITVLATPGWRLPIEILVDRLTSSVLPFEATGTLLDRSGLPFASIGWVSDRSGLPFEAVVDLGPQRSTLPWEDLATALDLDKLPLEALRRLAGSFTLPAEWGGLVTVSRRDGLPLVSLASVARRDTVLFESDGRAPNTLLILWKVLHKVDEFQQSPLPIYWKVVAAPVLGSLRIEWRVRQPMAALPIYWRVLRDGQNAFAQPTQQPVTTVTIT